MVNEDSDSECMQYVLDVCPLPLEVLPPSSFQGTVGKDECLWMFLQSCNNASSLRVKMPRTSEQWFHEIAEDMQFKYMCCLLGGPVTLEMLKALLKANAGKWMRQQCSSSAVVLSGGYTRAVAEYAARAGQTPRPLCMVDGVVRKRLGSVAVPAGVENITILRAPDTSMFHPVEFIHCTKSGYSGFPRQLIFQASQPPLLDRLAEFLLAPVKAK